MSAGSQLPTTSNKMLWTGRIISGIVVALFLFSGVMKLMMKPTDQEKLDPIGWKVSVIHVIAVIEIACAVIYAIPQTAVLGAILLAGYLGGACATHVRVGEYSMSFAPVGFAVLAWIGLYLRDARVRDLAPLRRL